MNKGKIIAFVVVFFVFTTYGKNIELSEKPVLVSLSVNEEIIIKFPHDVQKTEFSNDTPTKVKNSITQLLTPDGVLYLTANKVIPKTRLIAQLINGQLVMLDLAMVKNNAVAEDINIVLTPQEEGQITKQGNPYKPDFLKVGGAITKQDNDEQSVDYVDMVQFAFRHYVGPQRLIGDDINAKAINTIGINLDRFIRVWGTRLSAKPLKQWKVADKYVTVLLVNNISTQPVEFDPRSLRGQFMFSAALNPILTASGTSTDQTLWAFVTAEQFQDAID